MKSFFETINYSSVNEDSNSEFKALNINKNDTVLCITGSGARILDLLIKDPKEIVAVDFNPCQNFLLELKIAAIQKLEYEDFLRFIGIMPCPDRKQLYRRTHDGACGS